MQAKLGFLVFFCLFTVGTAHASPIDFRVRSASGGWEVAIYEEGFGPVDQWELGNGLDWNDTTYNYTIEWESMTGEAVFWSDAGFHLSHTFDALVHMAPSLVELQGKDSADGSDLSMTVAGGPGFATEGEPGWLAGQEIPIAHPHSFSLTGTFRFSSDSGFEENLKGQVQFTRFEGTSAPVPEPGTLMLLGAGLLGLVGLGRRRALHGRRSQQDP